MTTQTSTQPHDRMQELLAATNEERFNREIPSSVYTFIPRVLVSSLLALNSNRPQQRQQQLPDKLFLNTPFALSKKDVSSR